MSIFFKAYIDIFKIIRTQGVYKPRCMFNILHCTKMEKQIQFGARRCQKYELYEKTLKIKVVEHWILHKKVSECTIS